MAHQASIFLLGEERVHGEGVAKRGVGHTVRTRHQDILDDLGSELDPCGEDVVHRTVGVPPQP